MRRSSGFSAAIRALVAVLALASSANASAENPCLASGSGLVTVTGTLIQKLVPGAPGSQSDRNGDAAHLCWQIRLETTMCVTGAPEEATDSPNVSDVRVIQLVLPLSTMEREFALVGKRVVASGFVSTRQHGREQAVVLLDTKTIDEAP